MNRAIIDDAPASSSVAADRAERVGADFVVLGGYDRVLVGERRDP